MSRDEIDPETALPDDMRALPYFMDAIAWSVGYLGHESAFHRFYAWAAAISALLRTGPL